MSLGVPINLLHEATGFLCTIELISGDKYRGVINVVDDKSMNIWLKEVEHTLPDGSKVGSDSAFIRGSNVLYVKVPDMLSKSTLFVTGETSKKPKSHVGKLKRSVLTIRVRKQNK